MTQKLVFIASLLDIQHKRDNVKQFVKLLVALLGRHLMGFIHLSVVDRWPTTPRRARAAPRRFL